MIDGCPVRNTQDPSWLAVSSSHIAKERTTCAERFCKKAYFDFIYKRRRKNFLSFHHAFPTYPTQCNKASYIHTYIHTYAMRNKRKMVYETSSLRTWYTRNQIPLSHDSTHTQRPYIARTAPTSPTNTPAPTLTLLAAPVNCFTGPLLGWLRLPLAEAVP